MSATARTQAETAWPWMESNLMYPRILDGFKTPDILTSKLHHITNGMDQSQFNICFRDGTKNQDETLDHSVLVTRARQLEKQTLSSITRQPFTNLAQARLSKHSTHLLKAEGGDDEC
jgi:hypothetical protein